MTTDHVVKLETADLLSELLPLQPVPTRLLQLRLLLLLLLQLQQMVFELLLLRGGVQCTWTKWMTR